MVRILVTGFEPFGEHVENISKNIVNALPSKIRLNDPWSDLRQTKEESFEAIIETRVLSVDEAGSLEIATAVQKGEDWDAILHLGLCESCQIPRIETLAQDHIHMKIPDNKGRQILEQTLSGHGNIPVSLPVGTWNSPAWPIECEISQDAGSFLCNETFYRTLSALTVTSNGGGHMTPCLFLHLPSAENCTLSTALELVHEILPRMMFRPVLSVVGALMTQTEHYLVAQRSSSEMHSGKWEFPGGKVEPNETHSAALEREIHEEFGWQVECSAAVGTWYHALEKFDIALHILPTTFIGSSPNFEDKGLWTAHDDICWRHLSDDSPLDWLGNDAAVVQWMRDTKYLAKAK